MNIEVEVKEETCHGDDKPTLDEVLLSVDGQCLFHLEQLCDNEWAMVIGDPQGQCVKVMLRTKRALIRGGWDNDGLEDAKLVVNGREVSR